MTVGSVDLLLIGTMVAGGLTLIALTAWRPVIGGIVICLAVPLTAGLNVGSLGSFLKPDQVLIVLVLAGVMLRELLSGGRIRYGLLDLAVIAYCVGEIMIPFLVVWLGGTALDLDTVHTIAAPGAYLVVYLIFAREQADPSRLRLYCNLAMASVVIVSLIGILELLDAPFVRDLMATAYETETPPPWDPVYRATSTVMHFSGLGAFSLFGYTLALSLSTSKAPGYNQWWLGGVMVAGLVGIIASLTYAPAVALPFVTAIVCLRFRHVPRNVWLLGAGGVVLCLVLWPFLLERINQQLNGGASLLSPETLTTRIRYWQEFFYPAWTQHGMIFGTGTVLPAEIPVSLSQFVDNAYLMQAFRGGVVGVALELGLYLALGITGWRLTARGTDQQRALGATLLALTIGLVALDVTSAYLPFAGFSEFFWMLVGLAAAMQRRATQPSAVALPPLEPRLAREASLSYGLTPR